MKRHRFYGGLLVNALLVTASCSSLTSNIRNNSPATGPEQHQQAILSTAQVIPKKTKSHPFLLFIKKYTSILKALVGLLWLWLLARFYAREQKRRIKGWRLEDLALLKIIKDNSARLWNSCRPDRKVVRLEEWRG